MSGDGIGILIGGVVLVKALPIIVGSLAIYGAARAAVGIGRGLYRLSRNGRERRRDEELTVQHCSPELDRLYRDLNTAISQQSVLSDEYRERLQRDIAASARRLEEQAASATSADWRKAVMASRREMSATMEKSARDHQQRLAKQLQTQTAQCFAELDKSQAALQDLVDWQSQQADARAKQKSVAELTLRDVRATLTLLERLIGSSALGIYPERLKALRGSAAAAQEAFDRGQYQLAVTTGQSVITEGARTALAYTRDLRTLDQQRDLLLATLDGCLEELRYNHNLQFVDEYYQMTEQQDLDLFTQGQLTALEKTARELQQQIEAAQDDATLALLSQEAARLRENIDLVLEAGRGQLISYYKRLHMMEKLQGFMESQNYDCSWCTEPGEDHTQELVASFVHRTTGNRISISLSEQDEDADEVALSMHTFDEGCPIPETDRQALRQRLLEAMGASGMTGSIQCCGNTNQPSAQPRYATPEGVESTPIQPLFEENET